MNKHTKSPSPPLSEDLSPRQALDVYLQQSKKASLDLSVSSRGNSLIWGAAWLAGYGALWIGARQTTSLPPPWAFVIFGICLAGAVVASALVAVKTSRSVSGPSNLAGALFGWACFLAFAGGIIAVTVFCQKYALNGEATGVLYNAAMAIILGCLYMAGAAMWKDRAMYIVGAAMIVLGVIGTLVGVPAGYLVMALCGGGLMLVEFVYETWRLRRTVDQVK